MAARHDGSIPKATTHEFDRCRAATNRRVLGPYSGPFQRHGLYRALKRGKEGYLIFGDKTKSLLVAHISENEPSDYLL